MVKTILLVNVNLPIWFKVLNLYEEFQRERRNITVNGFVWNVLIMDNQLWAAATWDAPEKKMKTKLEVFQGFLFLMPHHKSLSGSCHILLTPQFPLLRQEENESLVVGDLSELFPLLIAQAEISYSPPSHL